LITSVLGLALTILEGLISVAKKIRSNRSKKHAQQWNGGNGAASSPTPIASSHIPISSINGNSVSVNVGSPTVSSPPATLLPVVHIP
jgi:hypothetical protein